MLSIIIGVYDSKFTTNINVRLLFAFKLGHLLHITYLKVHILFCIMFGVAVYIANSLKVCLCLCPEKDKVQLIP